jgi:hypothetical protein
VKQVNNVKENAHTNTKLSTSAIRGGRLPLKVEFNVATFKVSGARKTLYNALVDATGPVTAVTV